MNARLSGIAVLQLVTVPLAAQRQSDLAAVDSSAAARGAYQRAVAAWRAGDWSTAKAEVDRAARAWPGQPVYLWGRVAIRARTGDTSGVRWALEQYAALGLGRDLEADTSLARFLSLPGFATVVATHAANRAPLVKSRPWRTLPDSTFWPEGMDYDPRTGNAYVASVRHRTIAEISPAGVVRELWSRKQPGLGAMFGVRVDPRGGVLWATTSGLAQTEGYQPADSGIAGLLRIRIADGTIERRWDLPSVAGGHALGDLAVGPDGDVYLTDSQDPVLYRLRPGRDSLERTTSKLFFSPQGLAPTPDGKSLYLADYAHGLLKLDLATGQLIRLEDAPGSTSVGCDGIAWDRGAIIAVQNGVSPARIVRFVLDQTGNRIARAEVLDRNLPVADEPTIGAMVNQSFVYVANSQWEKYADDGTVRPGAKLARPVLLAVPLR
jgi:sugar lactone lactonase YvrE